MTALSDAETAANDILNKNNTDSKTLVVYFSRTGENYNVGNVEVGNTAMVASYIKEYLKADSFEIVPIDKYPDNYDKCTELAQKEKDDNARPKITGKIDNFDSYDTVFVGYPIWWGDLPMIMYTFMEEYDFNGKKIIPFNTHEGSGDSGTYQTIQEKLPNADVNTKGLALEGKVARSDDGKQQTIDWLKGLGY
ncbi:MAG: NAD(P)H-dependent oxidoreductase [Methanobrevibacter sp.]|uniref:flavodoxin n=1 Tax=Methanobrevibacter sp. TaxID=66852 RepID=UPI001B2E4466|nr:flavodoxin [Methanobrevibacter sp.]MBO6122564.1 NAD(P)H-dependent oxidoreductase [Methanobrevibacter sp.]MBP3792342.1 NAD(P)H-dependent oxidoreductase [Methanobrevibacter sp.]